MEAKDLLSAAFTVLGAAALLAASGVLTVAVTMAALDGSWTQAIDFNGIGEGPLELVLAWALLPAVGWVLRGALENEAGKLAAARQDDQQRARADEHGQARASIPDANGDPRAPGLGAIADRPRSAYGVDPMLAAMSQDVGPTDASPIDGPVEPTTQLPAALAWARAYTDVGDHEPLPRDEAHDRLEPDDDVGSRADQDPQRR